MNRMILVVLMTLVVSTVVAEERDIVVVVTAEDAERAESGTILRGEWAKRGLSPLNEIVAKYCNLETFVTWDNVGKVWWVCEKV